MVSGIQESALEVRWHGGDDAHLSFVLDRRILRSLGCEPRGELNLRVRVQGAQVLGHRFTARQTEFAQLYTSTLYDHSHLILTISSCR